jgi:His-Xaa-Ser system radical SAM maturase HxsC
MIALWGRASQVELAAPLERAVWLLVDRETATSQRHARAYLVGDEPDGELPECDLYVTRDGRTLNGGRSFIQLPERFDYLTSGDILGFDSKGERVNVLWRHESLQNSVLLTERCDHYCLMCSQPPKNVDDDHLLDNAFELVRLLPQTTREIGFTGGEPTLYGDSLIRLLRLCRNLIPHSAVHVLSNGRRFSNLDFALDWAGIDNPNLMVGIPIYGPEPALHDYVVQSQGAFDATVAGILNLGRLQQRIEIRVVVHKQTAPHLVEIAEFISRNLPFVEQVALMGLEMIGFARANIDDIWIDPVDYRNELREAVTLLDRKGLRALVYNHPLCLIDRKVWPYAVRSISDWKNEYHPECLRCSVAHDCSGFFYSAKYRHSDHIKAIDPREDAMNALPLLELAGR